MANLIYQGKINRQSTITRLQKVTWGGGAYFILKHKRQFNSKLSNKITFFSNVLKE